MAPSLPTKSLSRIPNDDNHDRVPSSIKVTLSAISLAKGKAPRLWVARLFGERRAAYDWGAPVLGLPKFLVCLTKLHSSPSKTCQAY
jgi:hypothetical protein